jgi:hypothetical protein
VDAVSGGNESPYGYPNDPVNKNDFSGLWGIADFVVSLFSNAIIAIMCLAAGPLGCFIGSLVLGVVASAISSGINATSRGASKAQLTAAVIEGLVVGLISSLLAGGFGFIGKLLLGRFASARSLGWLTKQSPLARYLKGFFSGTAMDAGIGLIYDNFRPMISKGLGWKV